MAVTFHSSALQQLSALEAHAVFFLRCAVFTVEQQIVAQDIDAADAHPGTRHLRLLRDGELVGYGRIVPTSREEEPELGEGAARVGRVAVRAEDRGTGLGRELVGRAVAEARRLYPHRPVSIHAQAHLRAFYESLGFEVTGPEFTEAGVRHVPMRYIPTD